MEIEHSIWLTRILVIAIILFGLYCIAGYSLEKYRKKHRTPEEPKEAFREHVTRINKTLLDSGMSYGDIREFWDECFVEGQIRYSLPPCTCNDVNQCETWCQAKARFTLNPPID